MTLPKKISDKVKAGAENYAGVMVWINEHQRGEEQLFYEYISATSHEAGATEWAGKAQPVIDMLETTISILSAFIEPALWNQEISNEQRILINTRREIETALAKYKEVTNG